VAANLADADDVTRLAEESGAVDVLVNDGGVSWFGPTDQLDTPTYDRLFAATSGRRTNWSRPSRR
jgi:NADP-dependent 3-hydroxy acid dehydrogenase YdfG